MQRSRRSSTDRSVARSAPPARMSTMDGGMSTMDGGMSTMDGPSESPTLDAFAASGGGSGDGGSADGRLGSGGVDTWEDGDLMCEGDVESTQEMDLVTAYANDVRRLVAPWRTQRSSLDLVFDTGPLNRRTSQFREDYRRQFQLAPTPGTVRQALDHGDVRPGLEEIFAFNPHLVDLPRWLDLPSTPFHHHYTLTTIEGVQATAILGARGIRTTLTYSNDHGMGWSQEGSIVYVAMNGDTSIEAQGASVGGVGVNLITAGSPLPSNPDPRIYFSPEDFGASTATFLEIGAGVSAGPVTGGATAEALILEGNGHRVQFDNSASLADGPGLTPRIGTNDQGQIDVGIGANVGAQTGVGGVTRTEPATRTSTPEALGESEAPQRGGGRIEAVATLFFATQVATVGPEQRASLRELVAAMQDVERRFPGAIYQATITGTASRRWRGAANEEEALALNTALAHERAENTGHTLESMLDGQDVRFTPLVRELSTTRELPTEVHGDTPESNLEEDRAVFVTVTWRPCDRDQRAQTLTL